MTTRPPKRARSEPSSARRSNPRTRQEERPAAARDPQTAVGRAVARAANNGGLPAAVSFAFPDTEHLADTAATHPDLLADDTSAWITEAVFEEGSLRR
ncbi:hypothetical protein ACIRVF_39725 [Kitasatospora sp. NPDC101157]|uniref:hypothetical protein n=1 Tax=Kitasatospora sp. NPDC101157 TaxID=3364098 RepID=UPI00380FB891